MNEMNCNIDSAKGLVAYLKSAGSKVKVQNRGAEIIIRTLTEHNVELHTDKEGALFQSIAGAELAATTIDDVIDLACEYNYEDTYLAEQSVGAASDFVEKCKAKKKVDELQSDGRILNKIFYQTKYGRKVNMVADKICTELFTKLNLVPVYDVPFYEDKMVSELSSYDSERETDKKEEPDDMQVYESPAEDIETDVISEEQIVSADSLSFTEDKPEVVEQSKGAR